LLDAGKLQRYSANNRLLLLCLSVFTGGYFLLPLSAQSALAGLVMIFIAHIASNIVFATGTFGVLKNFPEKQVAKAGALAWRGQILSAAVSTGLTSVIAQNGGAFTALYSMSLFTLGGSAVLLWFTRAQRIRETG